MNSIYDTLAQELVAIIDSLEGSSKFFLGLAGAPGSSKTTSAHHLLERVNKLRPGCMAILPMDGFHLPKSSLDAMPNPEHAYNRRGSVWTFDPASFLSLLQTMKQNGYGSAPSFDHKQGDPVADAIHILPSHKLILVEGNYLYFPPPKTDQWTRAASERALGGEIQPEWEQIRSFFDAKWFVDCELDVAMERVRLRHMGTGLSDEAARQRCDENDGPNAVQIQLTRVFADKVFKSENDEAVVL